ncbi:MAG: gluconate 2-dehydrogenase subunit 3 family protein [Acidobacteria bacterium]|nr:gluconate 2-dehydrogenase subunit 3 family protein [Acidobacteriota bacterium]
MIPMNTRRELIQIGAAIAVTAQEHHGAADELPVKKTARFFKPAEMDLLAKIVDAFIPPSDTPGAAAAGAHYYIDWQAHANKRLGERLRRDLAWVRKNGLDLAAWHKSTGEPKRVFTTFKDLTIEGYYGTREGLHVELGWNANTFLREYHGCTHKEHA